MKKREFIKLCRGCVEGKQTVMSGGKIRQIPIDTRKEMVRFLLSKREPIVREMLDGFSAEEIGNIEACGYMYWYKTVAFDLLGNSEWRNKREVCVL